MYQSLSEKITMSINFRVYSNKRTLYWNWIASAILQERGLRYLHFFLPFALKLIFFFNLLLFIVFIAVIQFWIFLVISFSTPVTDKIAFKIVISVFLLFAFSQPWKMRSHLPPGFSLKNVYITGTGIFVSDCFSTPFAALTEISCQFLF